MKNINVLGKILLYGVLTLNSKLSYAAHLQRYEGPGGTGGGLIATDSKGQRSLLDIMNYAPQTLEHNKQNGKKIPLTKSLKAWGVDTMSMKDLGHYEGLKAKVEAWQESSPFVIRYALQALDKVKIYVLNHNFGSMITKNINPHILNSDIKSVEPVAFYSKDIGFFLSVKQFESLNYLNQQATLLHETLRHLQLTYKFDLTESQLQKLTVLLITAEPNSVNLDDIKFIGKTGIKNEETFKLAKDVAEVSASLLSLRLNLKAQIHNHLILLMIEKVEDKMDGLVANLRGSGTSNIEFSELRKTLDELENIRTSLVNETQLSNDTHKNSEEIFYKFLNIVSEFNAISVINSSMDLTDSIVSLKNAFGVELITRDINKNGWWFSKYRLNAQQTLVLMKEIGLIQ